MEQFSNVAHKLKLSVHEAIANPFFYYKLAHHKIKSVDNLQKISKCGLVNSPKNQIEIWYKRRKVQKFTIDELNASLLLLPLFKTSKEDWASSTEKGIYLEQKEFGLIGSYEIETNNFVLDHLHFDLFEYNNVLHLENFTYEAKNLLLKKEDALITYQNTFEIK